MNSAGAVTLGRGGSAPAEPTVGVVKHPDYLLGGVLIDDPTAARLQRGDPAVGWEGDPRVALYLNRRRRQWELWRLEADNVYRQAKVLPADGMRGIDAVGAMLLWLVTHDGRRGFAVLSAADTAWAAEESRKQARHDDMVGESADRMAVALIADGVQPRDTWSMTPTPAGKRRRI